MLVESYHQELQAEENEEEDNEEDTSKLLDEILKKKTVSPEGNGDSEPKAREENKEISDRSQMNGVETGKG